MDLLGEKNEKFGGGKGIELQQRQQLLEIIAHL
jgi:hypothetical protein